MDSEETNLLLDRGPAYQKLSRQPHRILIVCLVGYLTATIFVVVLVLQVWQSLLLSSLSEKINAVNQVGPYNINYANQEFNTQSACLSPNTRHSWRSLSSEEKTDFIDAILCLSTKPSFLVANTSIYDDFTRIHAMTGKACKPGL